MSEEERCVFSLMKSQTKQIYKPSRSNFTNFSRRTFMAEASGAELMDRLCRPCGVVQLFFS